MTANNEQSPSTMNCVDIQQEMVAYLKGGLPAGRREAFQQHLLTCAACEQAVQQARAWEAEMRLEARRARQAIPPVSADVSARIQEKVYRRMRRALLFQRSLNVLQRAAAVAVLVVVVVGALVLFNPWRIQLATLGTAAPDESLVNEIEVVTSEPADRNPDTAVVEPPPIAPTATPRPSPTPIPAQSEALPAEPAGRPEEIPATDIVARETPQEAAMAIIDAAIAADDLDFLLVVEHTLPLPEASFRVWRRLERCQGQVSATDLDYRVMVHRGRFASVYVFGPEGRYLGDVKMWLHRDGSWHLSTLNYSSFSSLKHDCIR